MRDFLLEESTLSIGKLSGPSPAESRYYVLVFFDVSDAKKYRQLVRILGRFTTRIQKSVFEGYLKPRQIKEMTSGIRSLMASEQHYDSGDNVRIYRIAAKCEATVFGRCGTGPVEDDVFI